MTLEATVFVVVGLLLIIMAASTRLMTRLPLTGAMVYLAVGIVMGPACAHLFAPNLDQQLKMLRGVTETGLMISLFAIGMYLRVPLNQPLWRLPLRLAGPAMLITIALMFVTARWGVGLEAGPALMLAAALAPTDPVLANELRVLEAGDDEPLRFTLSAEGGLNDGAAYPFAIAALWLCGAPTFGSTHAWTFALAVAWGIVGALLIGWLLGTGTVMIATHLRTRHEEALGLEGFFALGLMALSYGAALLVHTYAFIAVFAAGVAVRRQEFKVTGTQVPNDALKSVQRGATDEAAKDPDLAHAYMAESMMAFSVEIERLVELALMLIIGSVISLYWRELLHWSVIWPVLVLLFIARPAGVLISLLGSGLNLHQRLLSGWLGIRGVGAFYYLLYGLEQVKAPLLTPIIPIVLATIVLSVVLHGASATALLHRYFGAGERG
ncbi:sodium:proton antiporter [Paraburkholderia sp. DHOC27]|uniref:cation:proton antiporter n=1 Tax=Paraburkholderia sp. DHOC27 TaxID=2303330 RepID=UPI000E3E6BDA|nr:cation:proton antiporter [Paraburkholderia sp. DHOC27]RFU45638.1 sodium:proton antiporter [Paraburkholderia sp. DHOC27]